MSGAITGDDNERLYYYLMSEAEFEAMHEARQELRSADVDRREWAGDEHAERLAYGLMRG